VIFQSEGLHRREIQCVFGGGAWLLGIGAPLFSFVSLRVEDYPPRLGHRYSLGDLGGRGGPTTGALEGFTKVKVHGVTHPSRAPIKGRGDDEDSRSTHRRYSRRSLSHRTGQPRRRHPAAAPLLCTRPPRVARRHGAVVVHPLYGRHPLTWWDVGESSKPRKLHISLYPLCYREM